jgi:hypothetical protein
MIKDKQRILYEINNAGQMESIYCLCMALNPYLLLQVEEDK